MFGSTVARLPALTPNHVASVALYSSTLVLGNQRAALAAAIARAEWRAVKLHAHYLKSSASVVQDDRLYHACTALEDAADGGDMAHGAVRLGGVHGGIAAVVARERWIGRNRRARRETRNENGGPSGPALPSTRSRTSSPSPTCAW